MMIEACTKLPQTLGQRASPRVTEMTSKMAGSEN